MSIIWKDGDRNWMKASSRRSTIRILCCIRVFWMLPTRKISASVDVELIQYPSDENKQTAICKARVETVDGKKFSDIGDANPQNCNSKVARHLIRMASTRAKARAFRDMDNIGMTALEELGDFE